MEENGNSPLSVIRATRAELDRLDADLAEIEARIRSRERVESVWRQATDHPRDRRESHREAVLAR
jgi:hypothetical protein